MGRKKKVQVDPEPDNQVDPNSEIVKAVVDQLKPELDKKIISVRNDLANDIVEKLKAIQIQPSTAPEPGAAPVGAPAGLGQLMESLKGGNIDLSKIGSILGSMQAPAAPLAGPGGVPLDIEKLTPGQIEYMKMQKQDQQMGMLMQFLPALIGQNQGSPFMGEMVQRIFMENVASQIWMNRTMMQGISKMFTGGKAIVPDTGLTTPITDSVNQMNAAEKVKTEGAKPNE